MAVLSWICKPQVQEGSQDLVLPVYRWYLKILEKSNVREFMKEKREKCPNTKDTPMFRD